MDVFFQINLVSFSLHKAFCYTEETVIFKLLYFWQCSINTPLINYFLPGQPVPFVPTEWSKLSSVCGGEAWASRPRLTRISPRCKVTGCQGEICTSLTNKGTSLSISNKFENVTYMYCTMQSMCEWPLHIWYTYKWTLKGQSSEMDGILFYIFDR